MPTLRERTWTRDEIVEDLRSALAIVDELEPPVELCEPVFNAAVAMLTQRQVTQAVPTGMFLPPQPH